MTISLARLCLALVTGRDGGLLLLGVGDEDRGAVLAAEVPALPVAAGRVVDGPERAQQIAVADDRRVKPHLDRLGVAGGVGADLLIRWGADRAAGVADGRPEHALDLTERRLDAPEASGGEGGALRALGQIRSGARPRSRRPSW